MILFKILINAIEAYIFPYFLSNYYSIENKRKFIIIYGTVQFFVLNICTLINQSGTMLTVAILGINYVSLFLLDKKIRLNDISIVFIYNFILLVCTYIALLIVNNLSVVMNENTYYIAVCIVSKILLLISTWYLLKYKVDFSIGLQKERWSIAIVFELLLLISTVYLVIMLVTDTIYTKKLYILLSLMMCLNALFIFIIYKVNTLNNENIKYAKDKQLETFNNEKLKLIKSIKNEIDVIDHRLFYVVFQIDNLLQNNETQKIEKLIDNYKKLLLRQKKIIDTENSIFDCLLSMKINDLIMNDVKVKTSIFVSKMDYYNDFNFISYLVNLLDLFSKSKSLQLLINEKNDFLLITLLYDVDFDIDACKQYLMGNEMKQHISYNIKKEDCIIKLLLQMKVE